MSMQEIRSGRRHRRAATTALLLAVALAAAACAPMPTPPPPATGQSPNDAPRAAEAAYVQPGPYEAGVTTLELADRKVEVWYPVDPGDEGAAPKDVYFIRDFVATWVDQILDPSVDPPFETDAYRGVPASSDGPFPLVVFSHGFASFRLQSTFLTTHLASWGFVVISPDYLERGLRTVLGEPTGVGRPDTQVAAEAIDLVTAASAAPGDLLEGVVDSSTVYPVGHSAGGGTSLRLLTRPDVASVIPLASGLSESSILAGTAPALPADKAIAWIGGVNDGIASIANVRTGFTWTPGERKLVEIARAGHNNSFTDLCEIGDGGIAAIARGTGLPIPDSLLALGDDGCPTPPFAPSPEVWDEVRHFVTAELRFRSGLDPEPVGLGDAVTGAFDDIAVYRHDP